MSSPAARRYRCSDGEIEINVQNAEEWRSLANCLGRPELAYQGTWDAVKVAPQNGPLADVVASMFAEEVADVWQRRLEAHGVPCRVR